MRKIFLFLIFCFSTNCIFAQLSTAELDILVNNTLKTFDVPGIQVGIVKDGKLIHAKGYGLASLKSKMAVDENTNFGIASNSKAFTAAALGILVDENKLTWDTKVIDIIPEFRMYNPFVTEEFTVRDLLTHRSGLGLGAGDLMFWPDSNSFKKAEIIHNLRFLKPVSSFRTQFDYDNLLYIVAGEVLARVSGETWENFIQSRIFIPLGISNSATSYKNLASKKNVIDPHAPVDGKVKVIRRDWSAEANAAGGIYSNVKDMSKWLICLMNHGKYGNNLEKTLISEKTLNELWTIQTTIPINSAGPYNSHFSGYGLGWFITDVKGYKQVSHTGGLAGIVTQTTLIPELGLGIMVYTNQQAGAAFNTITNSIKDSYLGVLGKDRLKEYFEKFKKQHEVADSIVLKVNSVLTTKTGLQTLNNQQILGEFQDDWFGAVSIKNENGKLFFRSKKSFLLKGEMSYFKGNTFIVKWGERSFDADAFVVFSLDKDGNAAGFKMEAISPLTDFSFDFQDLDFHKIY